LTESKIDDYLQQGIHGAKETKPDERRRFLSTLRERVVVALTQEQVRDKSVYPEVEALMHDHNKAHLFLNGNLSYPFLSKYIAVAKKLSVEFTIVTNKEHDSDLGLVLALEDAIDKEEIFIKKVQPQIEKVEKKKKSFLSTFQNLFKN
jgi:uncharacterized protein YueI